MDWWMGTVASYQSHLPAEFQAEFRRLMLSGAKTIDYMACHAVNGLANLTLARKDWLLDKFPSTLPQQELSRLRHAPLPSSYLISPDMVETAISRNRTASNDALVQKSLFGTGAPRIPKVKKSSAAVSGQGPSTAATMVSPVVPRQQKPAPAPSTSACGKKKRKARSRGGSSGGVSGTHRGGAGKKVG